MKHLKTFEKHNVINFNELGDNWSSEYNLDPTINYYKSKFKIESKEKIINNLIENLKKIGKSNYQILIKYSKSNFYITLPKYEQAIKKSYWESRYATLSKIIICLSSLDNTIEIQKEKIKKDIEILKNKLKNLEKI